MVSPAESLERFREAVWRPDEEIDLALAALLIAHVEYPELETAPVLERLDAMAVEVLRRAGPAAGALPRLRALLEVTLREPGIRGAREDYYDPRNSFLCDVLERKVGIPIALGILLIAVGARAGIPLGGTAMPMHFLARMLGIRPPLFLDGYGGGQLLTEDACRQLVSLMSQGELKFDKRMLEVVPNAAILERMLTNLRLIYARLERIDRLIAVLERLLALRPQDAELIRARGIAHFQLGNARLARQDLRQYLKLAGESPDADKIRGILRALE